ncbi:cytochrome P450 family protein [Bacillus cereus]|uniref:Cytochrome P450 n=1 Tax=Bacillus cereus TaxID=1396 RepID=A0A2B1KWE9_BACCE|nr:cytochrome P450 [Bacillus cereus]PFN27848.1 cytochrome P450 [Bacillus cereus]
MVMKNKVGLRIEDGINLASAQFKEDAYEIYKESRKVQPILFVNKTELGTEWLITRYEDALPLLKDNRLKKDLVNVFPQDTKNMYLSIDNSDHLTTHMLNSDPPNHSRLRSLVQKAFTPKMITQLEGRIQEIADDLINDAEQKGRVNLVDDYSFPLPIIVISEMLGIPKEDQEKFRIWSHAVIASPETPEEIEGIGKQLTEFISYLQYLVDVKRQEPKEDLVSALILAESEGHKLSAAELYSMIMLLIVAGHETTVNLITNTVLALLENPDQLQLLKNNPNFIDSAIEEGLRYYSPVEITTARWAAEPFQIHDQTIQKGDMVIIALASANRDETVFEKPEVFDITRENNRHIAFGHGSHFCLGAPLARLEAKIAISTLFNRIPELQIKGDREKIKWQGNYLMRSLEELPLTF